MMKIVRNNRNLLDLLFSSYPEWLGGDDRDRTLVVSKTTPVEAYHAVI